MNEITSQVFPRLLTSALCLLQIKEQVGEKSTVCTHNPTSQITLSKRSDNVTFSLLQRKHFTFSLRRFVDSPKRNYHVVVLRSKRPFYNQTTTMTM
jgi:hypothetical protein